MGFMETVGPGKKSDPIYWLLELFHERAIVLSGYIVLNGMH